MQNQNVCGLGCKTTAECESKKDGLLHKIYQGAKNIEVLASMNPLDLLGKAPTKRITQAEYDAHDCHLSEDDGCKTCVAFAEQKDEDRRAVDTAMGKLSIN